MRFNIVSLFPDYFNETLSHGVVGQAFKRGLIEKQIYNPRKFTHDAHKTVDDRPFGGGDGMVMMAEPLRETLAEIRKLDSESHIVYLSPKGDRWNDSTAREWSSKYTSLTLICGRYGGVDQRFLNSYVDQEVSVGDYVLSGGELGALVLIDSLSRFFSGVLGNHESSKKDSFAQGLLEHPLFTRPAQWQGISVPEILLSGDHSKIESFQRSLSLLTTFVQRRDLFAEWLDKNTDQRSLDLVVQNLDDISQIDLGTLGFDRQQVLSFREYLAKHVYGE